MTQFIVTFACNYSFLMNESLWFENEYIPKKQIDYNEINREAIWVQWRINHRWTYHWSNHHRGTSLKSVPLGDFGSASFVIKYIFLNLVCKDATEPSFNDTEGTVEILRPYDKIQIIIFAVVNVTFAANILIVIWPNWALQNTSVSSPVFGPVFLFKGIFAQCAQYQGTVHLRGWLW